MEAVIDKAIDEGAESIILECDLVETNNFDLQKWYERYDFVVIDRKCNPLMLAEFY